MCVCVLFFFFSYFLFSWWYACCIEEATTPYYQGTIDVNSKTLLMFSMVMNLDFYVAAK